MALLRFLQGILEQSLLTAACMHAPMLPWWCLKRRSIAWRRTKTIPSLHRAEISVSAPTKP